MKPILINSKKLKEEKIADLKLEIEKMGEAPQLVIISASDDKASKNYIKNKMSIGADLGILVLVIEVDKSATTYDLLDIIDKLNRDDATNGIILQLPTYSHLNSDKLIKAISPKKDADCFSSLLLGDMIQGRGEVRPCTPKGVINLLNHHGVKVEGKDVVVIGRSTHVGLSLSVMLTQMGATVTTCHSKTFDLENKVRKADIVISCVGRPELIKPSWMKDGSVIIGVGISVDKDGKQQTDYNIGNMLEYSNCSLVGDRLNCTGTATVLSLMENVVTLSKIQRGIL